MTLTAVDSLPNVSTAYYAIPEQKRYCLIPTCHIPYKIAAPTRAAYSHHTDSAVSSVGGLFAYLGR